MDFTFAELLRGFRQRATIKHNELAQVLNVHSNTVGAWERGDYLPKTREMVLQIAKELHLQPAETDQLLRAASLPAEYGTPEPQSYSREMLLPHSRHPRGAAAGVDRHTGIAAASD